MEKVLWEHCTEACTAGRLETGCSFSVKLSGNITCQDKKDCRLG